jgi:hypothetical protein
MQPKIAVARTVVERIKSGRACGLRHAEHPAFRRTPLGVTIVRMLRRGQYRESESNRAKGGSKPTHHLCWGAEHE